MLTSDIDVDRSIVTFRNEDGKTELTISTAPLADVEATPAAHLIPPPGISAETALKQTAAIVTSLTDSNSYIHIDCSDVISICASAAIRIIRFNAGDDPSKAFSDALAAQGVYGQINVYGVTTKSERHKRSYWTRTADGNGIGGRKAPVPYGS